MPQNACRGPAHPAPPQHGKPRTVPSCTFPALRARSSASLPRPPTLPPCPALQLLENLMKNPTLSDLVGGICSVTLGERAERWLPALRASGCARRALLAAVFSPHDVWRPCTLLAYLLARRTTLFLCLASPLLPAAGDEEARQRGTQKSVLERKAPPTFPLVIEMRERAYWVAHWVEDSVDCLLAGKVPVVQVRPAAG